MSTLSKVVSVPYEGHTLVLGLVWRTLRSTEATLRRDEARQVVERMGVNHAAVAETVDGRMMIGVMPENSGVDPDKAVSGAAWLAASVHKHTIYLQQLDSRRWWLAMVRPGEVEASGDLVGDAEAVGEALDQAMQDAAREGGEELPDIVVACTELPATHMLDMDGAGVRRGELKHVLSGVKPDARARFVRLRGMGRGVIYAALGCLAVLVLAAGGWMWNNYRLEQQALEKARAQAQAATRRQQELASLREARIAKAVADALKKDTATSQPTMYVRSVTRILTALDPAAANWTLDSVSSGPGRVDAVWVHRPGEFGTNAAFSRYASEQLGVIAMFDAKGSQASLSVPMPALESRPGLLPDELPATTDVAVQLGTWAQQYTAAFPKASVAVNPAKNRSITYEDPEGKGGNAGGRAQVPANKGYQVGAISADGTGLLSLDAFRPDFVNVTITAVTLTMRGRVGDAAQPTWHVEAQYVVAP